MPTLTPAPRVFANSRCKPRSRISLCARAKRVPCVKSNNPQGVYRTVSHVTSAVNYALDANGNLTSDGLRAFQYGSDNRLSEVDISLNGEAAKVTYLTNALGQRTFKSEPRVANTLPNETTLGTTFTDWLKKNFQWLYETAQSNATVGTAYTYGDASLPSWALLGEYGNGGANSTGRTEYIWLPVEEGSGGGAGSAIPIAMFRNNRYWHIHSDHLGSPRVITDDQAKIVWQWSYSAFGDNKPTGILQATANPNSALVSVQGNGGGASGNTNTATLLQATSPIAFNLRFPGQYADSETGQFYNYYRNYQATQGRYTQNDPIGLAGGMNRFVYVNGDAINGYDPLGLCQCVAVPGSKTKDDYIETWWGQKRFVGGQYSCTNDDKTKTETVWGTHNEWYLHKRKSDTGKEGNLLGQTYGKAMFSSFNYRYQFPQTGYTSFNPKDGASVELNAWATRCGCK